MSRIIKWDTDKAKEELSKRLRDSMDFRKRMEVQWRRNEKIVFNTDGMNIEDVSSENMVNAFYGQMDEEGNVDTVGINYTAKNVRFLHAQLSANPPVVTPRPTSSDGEDRRAADAAARLVRHATREYTLQEVQDRATLNVLTYGTGFAKTIWNQEIGDPIDMDEETGEITHEGDFDVSIPNVWDVYIDPDAECWKDVRFVFQRHLIPFEQALYKFPDQEDMIEQLRTQYAKYNEKTGNNGSVLRGKKYDVIEVFEYWEKGLPENGYMGRHCFTGPDGDVLGELSVNPERYSPPSLRKNDQKKMAVACLPYQILTDIDMPGQVWGKSFVEYAVQLQDMLNRIDNVTLDTMKGHGVARILLPEGAEIADDSITSSPMDIIKYTGAIPPNYMEPAPMPPIVPTLMQRYKQGIDDMSGVNENMFGQQSREQSGASMQYATNQGNMIRRRLFNKYTMFVEGIYEYYLKVVQKHWDFPRPIKVLGREKAFEVMDFKGADIAGGYAFVSEYGTTLSLDPVMRREEILTLMPIFEKAGVDARKMLQMLRLDDLSNAFDLLDLANDRQREIFEQIIASGLYIPPKKLEDHANMDAYSRLYVMTEEYKSLEDDVKVLIDKHIEERRALMEAEQPPAPAAPPGGMPGMPPAGGLPGL